MPLLLAPIDKPGFLGRILMPLRVIYSRAPALLTVGLHIEWMREHALAIEPGLRALVIARVSSHYGCEFCSDLGLAIAMRKGIDVDRFQQLDAWHTSGRFSPRERAALAWIDDILDDGRIEEATLVSAREVFSERELVELTWLQASEAYFNLQARPLGVPSDGLASANRGRRTPNH